MREKWRAHCDDDAVNSDNSMDAVFTFCNGYTRESESGIQSQAHNNLYDHTSTNLLPWIVHVNALKISNHCRNRTCILSNGHRSSNAKLSWNRLATIDIINSLLCEDDGRYGFKIENLRKDSKMSTFTYLWMDNWSYIVER